MSRRITTGEVGGAVGGLNITNTTLTTADDVDIVVNPRGSARFVIQGDAQLQAQGDLRFADSDSSNYVAFQAPAVVSSNFTWTLPALDGSATQSIVTNGSGVLSFASSTVSVTDNTVDASLYNIAVTTASSGSIGGITVSSTKLRYQPSTGTVFPDALLSSGAVAGLSSAYVDSNSTFDAAGYLTGYAYAGIVYSLITYVTDTGLGNTYGAQVKRISTWRETIAATNAIKNYTATYASTGRIASIVVS